MFTVGCYGTPGGYCASLKAP